MENPLVLVKEPGKVVVDELYVHLSAVKEVKRRAARDAIERVMSMLPTSGKLEPNVAKFNLKTGRLSLLAYPEFFDTPFPQLKAAWIYQPGETTPSSFRRYDDSINPPILHRKELLVSPSHPQHARWTLTTKTAENLGFFDDPTTIGFRVNWERLVASKGYQLVGDEFVPLGNIVDNQNATELSNLQLPVQRHLTALSRTNLSAPVQLLVRYGLLAPGRTFFDYGCGRGGDVAALSKEGYNAKGWDPHYVRDAPLVEADVVNLGFVVNVIEDPAERIEALTGAFRLARAALAVGVMLYGNDTPGKPFRDGFLSSRNTFQKYFSQAEFKDYLEEVLHRPAIMVGPGVAFVFANSDAEQRFNASRYRRRGLATRLLATRIPRGRPVREPKPSYEPRPGSVTKPARAPRQPKSSPAQLRLVAAQSVLDQLWSLALDLGRFPEPEEVPDLAEVQKRAGSLSKAQRMLTEHYDLSLLKEASTARADDVRLFMATQQFAKRPAYRQLEPRLQRDIKEFFGDYKSAQDAGLRLLVDAADPANILAACKDAAARGLGWLDGEHSLQLQLSMVDRLPAILRAYVACGLILWDSLSEVQLVKIHIGSGKLTLMEYDDFDEMPIPLLRRRIKVQVRRLNYEVFEYGSPSYPKPALFRKSRYLNEDYPGYAEQLAFDEALERLQLLEPEDHGPSHAKLAEMLEAKRLTISGLRLVRSDSIPDLDQPCGANYTYRDLIECGETQRRLGIRNLPLRPETYNALYDLATQVLDPVIDYFGSIRLTYGFSSIELTKTIPHGIAPKLDQHAACEHTTRGALVCDRGGAACDFIVADEDMREVANWIIEHLPFDRLYFYGSDRPIHVSYSGTPAREAFVMSRTISGRLLPRRYDGNATT